MVRKKLLIDSLIIFLIFISPFLYYLYEYSPDGDVWKTNWFTITSNGYQDLYISFWMYLSKIIPLLLLILWFLTCKHWWYHIILVPIAMYAFQLVNALYKNSLKVDEIEIYWLIPIMMVVVPIVYLIRIKLFDKLVLGIDLKKIEAELEEYERKEKEVSESDKLK
ncbi:hypothetical protein [Kordia zhangzhouensis]|uniref:hypothetical protein n=1 Tax=Kordia zhangzhouensis TaxID=1620405 RepID=UPI000A708482|nr:hypothetical protein [Kordia zhangzhouensis]